MLHFPNWPNNWTRTAYAADSQLAVNGRDLMAAGVPAGPGIRKVLEALLDGVIREEYPNERQALLAAVQQLAAS